MKPEEYPYEKQIFVCTNDQQGQSASCGDHQGETIFKELRRIAKEKGLHPRIRVAQAKCLGKCSIGCNIMVYPDNKWYSNVRIGDVEQLANQYLNEESAS